MRLLVSWLYAMGACVLAIVVGFAAHSPIPPTIALVVLMFAVSVETWERRHENVD